MKNTKSDKKVQYLTPTQAAEHLMVSPVSIRHWALDGKLEFVMTPGGHRRFTIDALERFADEYSKHKPIDNSDKRVLVVDDNDDYARYVTDLMRKVDDSITSDVAHDGFEAGRLLIEFRPQIVILDLMMPGLDGFEVCRNIKQSLSTSKIRVIAMTGFHSPENEERILAAGAEACLAKPIDKNHLFSLLGVDSI